MKTLGPPIKQHIITLKLILYTLGNGTESHCENYTFNNLNISVSGQVVSANILLLGCDRNRPKIPLSFSKKILSTILVSRMK